MPNRFAYDRNAFGNLYRRVRGLNDATKDRILRRACMSALLPGVRAARAAAPVGDVAHRTYKGRLVAPGHLKRSVRRASFTEGGKSQAIAGVTNEAFYGLAFLEGGTAYRHPQPWFVQQFASRRQLMQNRYDRELLNQIRRLGR